jgi:hypothetical protein
MSIKVVIFRTVSANGCKTKIVVGPISKLPDGVDPSKNALFKGRPVNTSRNLMKPTCIYACCNTMSQSHSNNAVLIQPKLSMWKDLESGNVNTLMLGSKNADVEIDPGSDTSAPNTSMISSSLPLQPMQRACACAPAFGA